MRKAILLAILILPVLISAIDLKIEEPVIVGNSFQNELPQIMTPGQPAIPYIPVKILLPMGQKLTSVNVEFTDLTEMRGTKKIDYVRQMQPISKPTPDNTLKDQTIYSRNANFPEMDYELLGTQRVKGYDLVIINVYPYKFNPVARTITWFQSAEISFTSEYDNDIYDAQNKKIIENYKSELEEMIINPEDIHNYKKTYSSSSRTLVDPNDPYEVIVITDAEREVYLQDFVNWKNDHDILTSTFLTSDIYTEYTGVNDQEKIKNFIIDAYETYASTSTPLEYVILGGDDEIIPIRTVFIDTGWGTYDYNMPCDLYYGCLDNDWDGNGNGTYGEVEDNVDLLPDVSVGRISAETQEEFENVFNKTSFYVDNQTVSDDIVTLIGENLNNSPLTWGGDYKDEVADLAPSLEDDYHINRLYQREGTYSPETVRDAINGGLSVINHMGHSNENIVFGQTNGYVNTYTNINFGFAYTQGCYPAAFDEATSSSIECIGENMVISEHGLYAFIGNTRYGWYSPGNTNGPSQYYDIAFFEAMFNDDQRQLGKSLSQSRVELVNMALGSGVMRWVHYELVIFGDPSVGVKYANGTFPYIQPVGVLYDDSLYGDNDNTPNPGEQIEVFIELENIDGWADAEDVAASITFEDNTIEVITGTVDFGDIAVGSSVTGSAFIIQAPQDCNYDTYIYTLHISAPVSGGGFFEKDYSMEFEVSLFQQYWPWAASTQVLSNPIICDFNADNEKDILIIDAGSNINLLQPDAQMVNGFPWAGEANIWKSTAYGDINNDNINELVISDRDGNIYALDNSGSQIFSCSIESQNLLTPMITDVNGDGQMDIVTFDLDNKLSVFDNNGIIFPNFPVELPMTLFCDMASADINDNGKSEILISTLDGNLYVFGDDGENIDGFPIELSAISATAPIILDNKKIVIGTSDNKLHIISPAGEILFTQSLNSKVAGSAIAADFDNDDQLEIAFTTDDGEFYIMHQNGDILPGWPVDISRSISNPPLAVDLDNDDNVELVCFTVANDFYAFHNDGTEVEFAPVTVDISAYGPSSVEDIDGDGDFDFISGTIAGALIIDCKLTKGTKIPWSTYRGNYRRTGYYGDNKVVTDAEDLAIIPANPVLNQNYPNPFNPLTNISFSLPADSKVDLNIYNIRGQKVRVLAKSESREEGLQNIQWNGTDDNGKKVGSGIYFYKLEVDNFTVDVKKCILLK
ncbi:MAG: T9SS type A sorting domain-containing protein [Candidatus Cloacimonetes bacterium]|nr:T9SS type A sorting domain-containing protein [Candidatus Cloacimonadota bacterium]